jgi:hypothetical protein
MILKLDPCGIDRTIFLKARKDNVELISLGPLDYVDIEVGQSQTKTLTFINSGSLPLKITGFVGIDPPYYLVSSSPTPPTWISPQDEMTIIIRYEPLESKSDSIEVSVLTEEPCKVSFNEKLKGNGVQSIPKAVIYMPEKDGEPGDIISLPLMISSGEDVLQNGPKDFIARIRYDKTLLVNDFAPDLITPNADENIIEVHGSLKTSNGIMLDMNFKVTLGKNECTNLTIDTIIWTNGRVLIEQRNGKFCLKNLCRAGGTRLIDPGKAFSLTVKPNPADANAMIEFQAIENAPTYLYFIDMIGRRMPNIFECEKSGNYSFEYDLSGLNSGIYRLVIQSSNYIESIEVIVIK